MEGSNKIDRLTVLIGEDEDDNYLLLNENFKKVFANVTLIRAVDGEDVVKMALDNHDINLILMDIRMPKLNGYEASIIIKKHKPGLPIIAQTAYALADDKAKAVLAGCDDYIAKPYEFDELFEKVEKCLTKYNMF